MIRFHEIVHISIQTQKFVTILIFYRMIDVILSKAVKKCASVRFYACVWVSETNHRCSLS